VLHVDWQWVSFWQGSPLIPAVHTLGVALGQCPAAQSKLSVQG
jgi:hypothetical protein